MVNLETYLKVKTGQDLINLKVIPKDSSTHIGLIAYARLKVIRNKILSTINDDMLGSWKPLIEQRENAEITDVEEIKRTASEGMKVIMIDPNSKTPTGLEAIVQVNSKKDNVLGVEFKDKIENGNDLNGKCANGYGAYVNYESVKLIPGTVTTITALAKDVVADEKLGHKVIFDQEYTNRFGVIPKGTIASLISANLKKDNIQINIDKPLPPLKQSNLVVSVNDAYKFLKVSSLGQMIPLDKEKEVRRQALIDFLPKTVIEADRAERIIQALLIGKDLCIYGAWGAGKSSAVGDIIDIVSQGQKQIFVEKDCKVQCNPYSLFDADFAKVVTPCPACKIKYDKNFKRTGRFKMPKPSDVEVVVAALSEGIGLESCEGTAGIQRLHLAGYKIPDLSGSSKALADDFDPEGFIPGILPRGNNGIVHMEELEKLSAPTKNSLLKALQDNKIKPDQLRFLYPAHSLVIGTANDPTQLDLALVDRMFLLAIRYSDDVAINSGITRKAFHKEFTPVEEIDIGNTHTEKPIDLRAIPLPIIIERGIEATYIKFRNEYSGSGKNEIMGGNRSKLDSLLASRAKLLIDRLFFKDAPSIVNAYYAIKGIQYSICCRVIENSKETGQKTKQEITDWVEKSFPDILKAEEDTWWCDAYKKMAISKTQIPEIENNCINELNEYTEDARKSFISFEKIKKAYENTEDDQAQLVRIQFPFMDYLFAEQPQITRIEKDQLRELIEYLIKSRKNTSCKIGSP